MTLNSNAASNPFCHIPYQDLNPYRKALEQYRLPLEIYLTAETLRAVPIAGFQATGDYLRDLGIPVMVHAPFLEMTPGGFESSFRALTKKLLVQAASAAIKLGARGMVSHLGFEWWTHNFNVAQWLVNAQDTFRAVIQTLDPHGVRLLLENVFEQTPARFVEFFEQVSSSSVAVCFDIAHVELFSKAAPDQWIQELAPHIVHVHLSDHHGKTDEHLPLGEGTIPFTQYFNYFHQNNIESTFTFEFGKVEAILRSRTLLKKMWLGQP